MARRFFAFHALQVAHSALFRAADKRTRHNFGLTTTQLAVLFVLGRKDGQPITDIAKTLSMGKSSLTGLIDRMCALGMVKRLADEADGRVRHIYLHRNGRTALKQGQHDVAKFNDALLEPFNLQERQTIQAFLSHVAENADTIINGDMAAQAAPDRHASARA